MEKALPLVIGNTRFFQLAGDTTILAKDLESLNLTKTDFLNFFKYLV